ncbi:MAG: aldolase [Clostridia bacterium]|nr:aldolase [Clostridia bacterium]
MNLLREKLEKKQKILGTLVSLTDPALCEIMGRVGFDCVWIDMEHTCIDCKDVLCHLNAARATDIPAVVRLPQNDLTYTKKVMEMDPEGIIFPMVRTAKEVKALIDMTLYPPHGTRGFGPLRAIGYGAINAKEYTQKQSFDVCRFVQIEHIDMIEELEEICKISYVDGFIFGPNDLSGSLGEFLNIFGDTTISAIRRAIEVVKRNGKYIGLAGGADEHDIKIWSELGLDLLFAGADWSYVYSGGVHTLATMKKYM